ncbi:DBH-like monooxygenase protein 2 homolog [Neocloeon triangulifer]|uniref:DBH-like monooxygenase protein 2 homolog n=1 Tax=Neocloeon triangulifer TaxID=2078957 RepID=UPI00286F1E47|nr:DBH-like monooxygenase protein 2 homolog [Neocloeon triangulifer]
MAALFIPVLSCFVAATSSERLWSRHQVLDHDSQFTLSWNPRLDAEGYFHFNLKAITKGYVGFGLSDTGTMAGADLVVAWPEKSGNATVLDMYASQNGLPRQDAHNDWHLKGSAFNRKTGVFQVSLARKIAAYDDKDLPIHEGPVLIIYSWGKTRALEHHGTNRRGAVKINLLQLANHSGLMKKKPSTFEVLFFSIFVSKIIFN